MVRGRGLARVCACFWFLAAGVCAAAELADGRAARLLQTAGVLADALQRMDGASAAVLGSARESMATARALSAEGRAAEAEKVAEHAYNLLRDAIRAEAGRHPGVAPGGAQAAAADALPNGFATRREAAREMRKAVLRVATEKGVVAPSLAEADAQLALADAHASAGRGAEAGAALEHSYDSLKRALVALRGGETLVRSLSFADAAEEFAYEIDRNDTFAMLVPLLAEGSPEARASAFLERARALRAEAAAAGTRGEFREGIRLLEESSAHYQKFMRNAGILLPG